MQKIIFIDGLDGAGKTTIIGELRKKIQSQENIKCTIIDKQSPEEFRLLYKIDKRKGFKSSEAAKFAIRFSRLNIGLNTVKLGFDTIGLFDRGILHFIVKSEMDKIDNGIIDFFVRDFVTSIEPIEFGTVFLNPPMEIISKRLSERVNPSEVDKDNRYLAEYYKLALKNYELSSLLGEKTMIDTNTFDVDDTCENILNFMKK